MSHIFTGAEQLIGHTPLLELSHIQRNDGLEVRLLAKVEGLNPAGSVKDRVALSMINDAEAKGILHAGSVLIEPTSGNTGIGLASVAAARGYRCIIVMPDSMSVERRRMMTAYGAEVVLTPGKLGMQGAIDKADALAKEIPGGCVMGQFINQANPAAHYSTTGPEIWEDTDGKVGIFVSGIGTGGTVSGVGKYLKEKNPAIQIVGLEPEDSPVLTAGKSGAHGIQGIGAGFVPETLNTAILDEVMTVPLQGAYEAGRRIGREEGLLCGISSGAALWAGLELAKRPENKGKTIVILLPDSGDRYLSNPMFAEA